MAYGETYDEFVEKFKPKLTTDDCYTPSPIYDKLLEMVVKRYGLEGREVYRPFYPEGDYTAFEYGGGVVIDNPPFSIMRKIVDFYMARNVPFFLFAPRLTLFGFATSGASLVVCDLDLTYQNGAKVPTSFVTNLEPSEVAITSWVELYEELGAINKALAREGKKKITNYAYPPNLLTSSMFNNLTSDIEFKRNEVVHLRVLDNQRPLKKSIFGSGFLISTEKARELREKREKREVVCIELSDREKELIKQLGG